MSANLENSAVATGLEKVSFHSNPKERQCQRMFKLLHNCTHLSSVQVCPTLCDPIEGSPPGSSVHGISQARVLEMSAIVQYEHSLALPFFGIGMKTDLFQSCGHWDSCYHMLVLFQIALKSLILFSIVATPTCIPTNNAQEFPFIHILANLCKLLSL